MRKLTPLQKRLRKKHTRLRKFSVGMYRVELMLGHQGFQLAAIYDKSSARWMCDMLAVALSNFNPRA